MSVVLHIGTYKTGTSSLQRFLRDHEQTVLQPGGLRFPHGWLRRDNHLELHLALMRPDRLSTPRARKDEWRDVTFRAGLVEQIADDLTRNAPATTLLSGEDNSLLRFDDELEALRALVGDARVIVYWRRPDHFLASLRDQLLKAGIGLSAEPEAFNYVEADSWQVDYEARTAAWSRHFTSVVALDYDDAVHRDGSVIPSFLRQLGVHDVPDLSAPEYWMNRRGEREQRVDGNRWTNGLSFGEAPAPALPEVRAATSSATTAGSALTSS